MRLGYPTLRFAGRRMVRRGIIEHIRRDGELTQVSSGTIMMATTSTINIPNRHALRRNGDTVQFGEALRRTLYQYGHLSAGAQAIRQITCLRTNIT